jgi:hypothetical protein
MNTAETWVKILYTYGPFAILVFLVFVTERKSRAALKEAPPRERATFIAVYVLNWAAIFGLVVFSVYAWSRINLDAEFSLSGTIGNLSGKETVTTEERSAGLYVLRNYVGNGRVAYEWRLITRRRFAAGEKISIVFDPGDEHEEKVTRNELTVRPDFYDKEVSLSYDRERNKLFVNYGGRAEELPQSKYGQIISRGGPKPSWNLVPVAHAQGGFSGEAFASSLESSDPIVRRRARADLAQQGEAAVPWIESVLSDPGSSYRLRLGVIVALNNMPNLRADALRPATFAAIKGVVTDPDETLRSEAGNFLNKYGSSFRENAPPPVVTAYEEADFGGRSQDFGPGKYRWDKGQFGSLSNDAAASVRVLKGYKVRLCDNVDGTGGCEEVGEGPHRLETLARRVSYIYVYKAGPRAPAKRRM